MLCRCEMSAFVPSLPRGHDDECIQGMLRNRRLRERMVRKMRRIKRAAVEANSSRSSCAQTQSLRTRNFLYKSYSGVPDLGLRL